MYNSIVVPTKKHWCTTRDNEISGLNPIMEEFKPKRTAAVAQMKIRGIQQEDKERHLIILIKLVECSLVIREMLQNPRNHCQLACKKIYIMFDKSCYCTPTQTVELHKQAWSFLKHCNNLVRYFYL